MEAVQPFAAILLVLGLLCGSLLLLKRKGATSFSCRRLAPGSERRMEVVERLPLGASHTLHFVRIGERSVVIATGPGWCGFICEGDRASGVQA